MIRFFILLFLVNAAGFFCAQKTDAYLLKNTTLITCVNKQVIQNACVLVKGDKIERVYTLKDIDGIEFDSVIDLTGKYIIPGLIDSHQHLFGRNVSDKAIENALRYGVTTVRDMGGDCEYLSGLINDIEKGELYGPDIYFSALVGGDDFIKTERRAISSTPEKYELGKAPGMRSVNDSTDLDQLMKESVNLGATGIKVYSHISPELIDKITLKAHAFGLKVWAHGVVPPSNLADVVHAGVNSISHVNFFLFPDDWSLKEHGSMAFDPDQISKERLTRVFNTMKRNNTVFDPTLYLAFRMANARINDSVQREKYKSALVKVVNEAYLQGVRIVAGTDIFLEDSKGYVPCIHHELKTYVEHAGMSNYDAILTATLYGAGVLGIAGQYGTIEEGKTANMVVLNSNPLSNIENTQDICMVIKNGLLIKNNQLLH